MNIDFAFEAEQKLAIFTYGGFVNKAVCSKWLHGTEEEKEEARDQGNELRTDISRLRNDMSASAKAAHTVHCFWRNFVWSFIQNEFSLFCTS